MDFTLEGNGQDSGFVDDHSLRGINAGLGGSIEVEAGSLG